MQEKANRVVIEEVNHQGVYEKTSALQEILNQVLNGSGNYTPKILFVLVFASSLYLHSAHIFIIVKCIVKKNIVQYTTKARSACHFEGLF